MELWSTEPKMDKQDQVMCYSSDYMKMIKDEVIIVVFVKIKYEDTHDLGYKSNITFFIKSSQTIHNFLLFNLRKCKLFKPN